MHLLFRTSRRITIARRFTVALPVVVASALVLGSTAAFGAWRTTSVLGYAAGQAHRLPDGPNVVVTHAGYAAAVTLSWLPGTFAGGTAVGGYAVRAYDLTTGAPRTVGGSCAGAVPGTGCTDTGVPDGRWRYTVAAAHGLHWLGTEGPASAPVAVDTSPPAGATLVALPAVVRNGQVLTAGATDMVSGVASVTYLGCAGAACVPAAVLGSSATGPDYAVAWTGQPADGTYRLVARVADVAGNVADSVAQTVVVDNTAPSPTVTAPTAGAVTGTTPTLAGDGGNAASDSATVTVRVYVGAGTGGPLTQTLTATRTGTTWSVVPVPLAGGTYTVEATQTDAAGNAGTSPARTFTVDATPPSVVAITGTNNSGKTERNDTLRLTFSEALDPASVPASTTVTFVNVGGGSGNDSVDLPGITNGPVSTGSTGWVLNNHAVTHNASIALSSGNTVVTVTITACALNCGFAGATGKSGTLVFVPAPSLRDVAGNAASGTTSVVLRLF